MSDLQIWLSVIGAAIVVAVLVFNWNQERRFRKQADSAFQAPMGDPLMDASADAHDRPDRREPALREPAFDLDDDPAIAALDGAGVDAAAVRPRTAASPETEPPVTPTPPAAVLPPARPAAAASASSPSRPRAAVVASPPPYDELIEYRIRIDSEGVLANVFADAFTQARMLGKAVRWLGLPVGASEWEDVQPWRDVHYEQVLVTLQLADRNGAAQEEQILGLCALLQSVAQPHGLRIACDDAVAALERAQAIDRFCVDVDVLIGLNVVARGEGTVNLSRIVREAESSNMVLGVDGVFQLLDSRGEPLFALCNHDAEPFSITAVDGQTSQGVTLQFDVPRVPDGLKVFDGMVAFGRKLASEVGGILVDDNLRPLTDAGIEKIRVQLTQIYERMEARGVPSGSRRALRLFS
ncbi:MAG: cell division protein ZipA C-terminal FtsZ-binding domain-containing protein [Gammaproteobacteria bacterium]